MTFVRGRGGKNSAVMRKTLKSVSKEERSGESVETEVLDEALRRTLLDVRKRAVAFKFEALVVKFMRSKKTVIKFPPIGSYHRMLLHHIADRFRMDHAVLGDRKQNDQRGVVLRKNARTEMPSRLLVNFDLSGRDNSVPQNVSIVKKVKRRETQSKRKQSGKTNDKCVMTHEERQKNYEEARARIFGSGGDEDEEESDGDEVERRRVAASSSTSSVKYSVGPDMHSNGFGRGRGAAFGFSHGRGNAFGRGTTYGRGREVYLQHQQYYQQHQNYMAQRENQWIEYQQQKHNYAARRMVDNAPPPPHTARTVVSSTSAAATENRKKQPFVDSDFPPLTGTVVSSTSSAATENKKKQLPE